MSELMSITEAAARFRDGSFRPTELLKRCLARIDRFEPQVRAWVVVDAERARRAAQLSDQRLESGRSRGALDGIPLGIKDIIDVEGLPTRAGSPLREDHIAQCDSPLVGGLRRAGAVILGKTVTVEFACFDPSPTRNPWNLDRSPGGSSSGSAAAVALGMCLGALGTQTGGSLVRPSTYCGISACKPTFGSLSTEGVVPVSHHLDHPGPMARTAGDLEILLRCLPRASAFGPAVMPPVSESESSDLAECAAPPRLGLPVEFFMQQADDRVRTATEAALNRLRDAGATIAPIRLPEYFDGVLDLHTRVMAVEAAAYHRELFAAHRDQYGPMIAGLLDDGLKIAGVDYAEGLARLRHIRRHVAAMLQGFDALIAPATDTTAPGPETTGPKTFQAPWSCSGLPVVSIPCGLAADAMPVAVQLIGSPGGEGALLAVARWCEARFGFEGVPPLAAGAT